MSVQADYYKFLIGELRTDGFKSQWRKDLERRAEEERRKLQEKAP